MSKPQISIPTFPPILFLHILLTTTITLTFPHSTTATPLPNPASNHYIPIHNDTSTSTSASTITIANHTTTPTPLRPRDIAGIAMGSIIGIFVVLIMGTLLTRLDWCIRKRAEWLAARNKAAKAEMKELEASETEKKGVVVQTREIVLDDDVSEITLIGAGADVDVAVGEIVKDVPRVVGADGRVDVRRSGVW